MNDPATVPNSRVLRSGDKDWIQTASGGKFYPLQPREGDLRLSDIAHHLAHICRFTGAVRRFYSVAQHSVLVSYYAEELARRSGREDPRYAARWGLLHDASEAYLTDISRPVKHQDTLAGYRFAEKRLQTMIVRQHGLEASEPAAVRAADSNIMMLEARSFMSPLHPEWVSEDPGWVPKNLRKPLRAWAPRRARAAFIRRFVELTGAGLLEQARTWLQVYLGYGR